MLGATTGAYKQYEGGQWVNVPPMRCVRGRVWGNDEIIVYYVGGKSKNFFDYSFRHFTVRFNPLVTRRSILTG